MNPNTRKWLLALGAAALALILLGFLVSPWFLLPLLLVAMGPEALLVLVPGAISDRPAMQGLGFAGWAAAAVLGIVTLITGMAALVGFLVSVWIGTAGVAGLVIVGFGWAALLRYERMRAATGLET